MAGDDSADERSRALLGFLGLEAEDGCLSPEESNAILEKFERRVFAPGSDIIREGEAADSLYVIDGGEAEAIKESEGGRIVGRLSGGAIFGELALFTGKPRAATVRAKTEVAVFRLAKGDFEKLSRSHPRIAGAFLNKLYARLGDAYRELEASEENLRAANRMRTELQSVFTNVVLVLTVYTFVLGTVFSGKIEALSWMAEYQFMFSRLIDLSALLVIVRMVRMSGQPLRTFGLSLAGWRRTAAESLGVSLLVMAFLLLCKAAALRYLPGLFPDPSLASAKHLDWSYATYIVVAPLQEFVARGAMQGSLQRLLVGRRSAFWAVLVTSFLFGSLHLYCSAALAVLALVTSWLWGWMYARHNSLLGVGISHFLVGNFAGLLGLWTIA